MNSTNSPISSATKEMLYELCIKIQQESRCPSILSRPDTNADTYFIDRSDDHRLFETVMNEYGFKTPAKLRRALEHMWDYQGCSYMKAFAAPVAIAAFQRKSAKKSEETIPTFNYPF